ncbi:LysR family transcriptional regulator [Pseudomonas sp. NPDC090201]|uniref:LysR family transcriptional regulator n=1 Tax=Pseudomonas sp. NPDC090201 TaxID=3364475 RepID=UPI0038189FAF
MTPAQLHESLADMALLVRVIDAGNFSEAARQLGSLPSSVSRQIKRLEQSLGAQLLERTTRRLRPTEAGMEVYRHCSRMLEAANSAVNVAGELASSPRGRVRLSAPTQFARTVLHPLVPAFLGLYPQIDVQLVYNDLDADPLADDVDLVIRLTNRPPQGLAGRPLGRVRWLLCASPGYLQRHGLPTVPSDLAQHQCVYLGETPDDNHWRLRQGDRTQSVHVKGRYIANHAGARLSAAEQDLGIANLPDFIARDALQSGRVTHVLPEWELDPGKYHGEIWLLYHPTRFLPAKVRVLIDYLIARVGEQLYPSGAER